MIQPFLSDAVVFLYGIGVLLITLYTIGQLHLLYYYHTSNREQRYKPDRPEMKENEWPAVTVQLPMYNERYVAKEVIDACAKLDYPAGKLEIQVVDDSTDETVEIVKERVQYWQDRGIDMKLFHRDNRKGYKAGALKDATPHAEGDFIAIFDADFRPESGFLRESVPYFKNEKVGVVQGRWGHINKHYSMLTSSQSLFLDMFFVVEQKARAVAGFFLRFNGSGGIWRKACIEDAGGWSADTLSEDLDLCYRAQLKGWEIVYDDNIVAPAEIPVTMLDFKTQQYRWTKGKAQVIRKLAAPITRAKISLAEKIHAFFDLFNIFAIFGILVLAVLSIPLIFVIQETSGYQPILKWFSIGLINAVIGPWFVWLILRKYNDGFWQVAKKMVTALPTFICIFLGIPLFQFVSMVDGFVSDDAHFHRTSKYNITNKGDSWKNTVYSPREIPLLTWFEGLFALYFAYGIYLDFHFGTYGFLPFHTFLTTGFAYVFLLSIRRG